MISFAKEPFVVTFDDGTVATDEGDILLLGVDGKLGLILAAKKLEWVSITQFSVVGQLISDVVAEGEFVAKDAPVLGDSDPLQ